MNRVRRKTVQSLIDRLEEIRSSVETVLDEEQDALDNMPENLEGSETYSRMEDAVDSLDSALGFLGDASDELQAVLA